MIEAEGACRRQHVLFFLFCVSCGCTLSIMTLIESETTEAKKRRIKLKKRKRAAAAVRQEEQPSSKPQNALFYLKNWSNRQETGWKFKKAQQVYLLKHGLTMQMSDEEFTIFCDYMKGLSDGARSALNRTAQQIVNDDQKDGSEIQDRARRLIQSLTSEPTNKPAAVTESSDESDDG